MKKNKAITVIKKVAVAWSVARMQSDAWEVVSDE